MIYIILLIKHKIQQRKKQRKKKLLHNLKNYVAVLKVLKNPKKALVLGFSNSGSFLLVLLLS